MLVTLAVWVYVTGLTYVYGGLVVRLWRPAAGTAEDDPPLPLPVMCLVGLAVLSAIAGLLSLFGPFSAAHHGILVAGAALALVSRRVTLPSATALRGRHPAAVATALILTAAACERATTAPSNYDTGLYHAQAIRWIEEYGVAPGLGNLHFRLAFDSAWFPLQALFGFAFLGRGPVHVLTGWVFACGAAFLASGLGAALRRAASVSNLAKVVLLPLSFAALHGWLSSPAPDVVVAVLLWVVLAFAYERAERGRLWAADGGGAALVVLCLFLPTLKFSALPAALLALVLVWRWWPSARRSVLLCAVVAAALATPVVARGLVLSAFPVFTIAVLGPFDFDWQVPRSVAVREMGWVLSWARVPRRSPAEVLRMTPFEWLPLWAPRLSWRDRLLLGLLVVGTVAALPRWWRLLRRRGTASAAACQCALVPGVAVAGALYWFALAPDPRFGIGFYSAAAILLGLELGRRLAGPPVTRLVAVAALAALVWQLGDIYVVRPSTWDDLRSRIAAPRGYPIVPIRTAAGANFEIAAPQRGDQCWYQAFPCTPYPSDRVARRGAHWASGFRVLPAAP